MTHFRLLVCAALIGGCFDDDQCDIAVTGAAEIRAYELRDPTTGTCQSYGGYGDCADPCGPCEYYDTAGIAQPDWAECYAACEGLTESACMTTVGCRAVYAGSAFHECWGVAPSGPVADGGCYGLDAQECSRHDDCVAHHAAGSPIGAFQSCAAEDGTIVDPGSCVGTITCTAPEPQCPADTLPGRRNGCWTGYCIPLAECDELPACNTLDEMGCIDRSDCTPLYEGVNCTCTMTGCTCQSWQFEACADAP